MRTGWISVGLLALVACGDDTSGIAGQDAATPDSVVSIDAREIDAPPEVPYNYSCPSTPPTTISAAVKVSGVAQQLSGTSAGPASGVTIEAYRLAQSGDVLLDTQAATTSNGAFETGSLPTNGTALDGYLKATKTGYWTSYLFPASPLATSLEGAPMIVINDANVMLAETLAQTEQIDGNGVVAIALTDCTLPLPDQIPNATVQVFANGTRVGDDTIDLGALLPNIEDVKGLYLITNVPPGVVTVKATYYAHTFLDNDVVVHGDALTTAQIRPGY